MIYDTNNINIDLWINGIRLKMSTQSNRPICDYVRRTHTEWCWFLYHMDAFIT